MSVSYEAQNSDTEDIQKQRWFFTLLSESQAETILNEGEAKQTRSSRFLVSNLPSSKDYRISIKLRKAARKKNTSKNVEHIIVSYNEEDQSYGIEGQNRYQSVVEVIRNYVASCNYVLEPFSGSLEVKDTDMNKSILMSLTSIDSAHFEEPPAYNAALQYPTDKRPLPKIKTKLDPEKTQEATLQRSLRMTAYAAVGALSGEPDWDADRSYYHWCVHPCHPGREFYSIRRAGCLRQLCFLFILFFVILACGWQCGCCAVVLACCCELMDDED